MKKFLFAFLALLLASCQTATTKSVSISAVWARPGLAGGNSAVYFTIEVHGYDDVLLSASGDVAEAVELHQTNMDDGQMHMQHMEHGIPLPNGQIVQLEPGGLHIMLIGLKQDLKVGDTFDLTLDFEKGEDLTITVTVQEP